MTNDDRNVSKDFSQPTFKRIHDAPTVSWRHANADASVRASGGCSRSMGLLAGVSMTLALVAWAAAKPPAPPSPDSFATKSPATFVEAMEVLHHWAGSWRVTERHFDRMGKVVADTTGTEEGRRVFDGHAVRRVYRSSGSGDKPYEAEGTLTWSQPERRFRGVWFDNLSTTGPSVVTAEWSPDSHTMIHTIERVTPDGKSRTFRTVERFTDHDHRRATTYEVNGSEMVKLIEVEYARTAPCPESRSGIRIIHDGLELDGR